MATNWVEIDASQGEGGGQIVRSALALSMLTGKPLRLGNIRARRARPGLQRQHLTAVKAAAQISDAKIRGAKLDSRELEFIPSDVRPGNFSFDIGTAGSTTLVLQTILPPLLTASGMSVIDLHGGTHNTLAPPVDHLARSLGPILQRMGPTLTVKLHRYGFYPAGGGEVTAVINPVPRLTSISLEERGAVVRRRATAIVSRLPVHIGHRELDIVTGWLGWGVEEMEMDEETARAETRRMSGDTDTSAGPSRDAVENRNQQIQDIDKFTAEMVVEEIDRQSSKGPGNVLMLEVEFEHVTELVTGFGQRGVPAEDVAHAAVDELQRYLAAEVPVGEHLADQLLLPMAMSGSGSFVTLPLSSHAMTNMEVIRRFLPIDFRTEHLGNDRWRVSVGPRDAP